MSSLSADRKTPVDYGVQIRFIKDLDDMGGGYAERSRGVGGAGAAAAAAAAGGTSPSSSYGVAVRVQGISGHPYVVLKDGEKGDSYGVQLKSQPQTQSLGRSSPFNSLSSRPHDLAQTSKVPYSSVASPEEEAVEFGSPFKRPPGDGQAGGQGDGERATTENRVSAPLAKESEKKDGEELNEAGLRPVRQNGIAGTYSAPGAVQDEPAEAIDTKSLAPIEKLISKFNSSATATMPSRIRGRSRARASLQFEERKRSQSLDAREEKEEAPLLSPTLNPYALGSASSGLTSPKPTHYSALGHTLQSSPSVAKVPAVPVSKAPTPNPTTRTFLASEVPAAIPNKQSTPELQSFQSQGIDSTNGVEAQEKQMIYELLREGCVESETSLRRKTNLIHERCKGLKVENEVLNSRLQQQLDQTKRELQHAQKRLVELRLETEWAESRCHQQEDELAALQEELRRVMESAPHSDSLHTELVTLQSELAEALMLRQKTEETLHMRERELTALKGALKDEVAAHDRDMEVLREQYSQNMGALQKSMEHVSQSQQEIEEERQKVNASILTLEEELDGYREQSDHWNQQMTSVQQERRQRSTLPKLLQAQQEKRELQETLLSLKETSKTDSHSVAQVGELQRHLDDLQHARSKITEQNVELAKKEEELRSLKRANQDREQQLQAEMETLRVQTERNVLEMTQQPRLLDTDTLEEENRYLKAQLKEAQRAASHLSHQNEALSHQNEELSHQNEELSYQNEALSHQNEELSHQNEGLSHQNEGLSHQNEELSYQNEGLSQQLDGREQERETLRNGKAELEEQKRLLDQALEKMNIDVDVLMGDSRQSVQTLQSQLDEFRDRSRKELQDSQRLNKERLLELQRTQTGLRAAQEEVSRLKKELLVCVEERESALLDKEMMNNRLKQKESELDTRRSSQPDRSREIRLLEEKINTLELDLDEEKTGAELLNERITRSREQVDQLRSELMQERAARHDLEMDKSSLERQVKELRSRLADVEDQPRSTAGLAKLESKIQELEDRLLSDEREKSSILTAHRRTERKLKEANAALDQERNHHAEQRDQLCLRVKALKRQLDDSEGEVERLEAVRRKSLRDLEEQQELRDTLQAKVSVLENELRRKVQQTRRPAPSSEEDDGGLDSKSLTSILSESQLPNTSL